MGEGHAVHERQTISSTTVVIFHTFCMENETELTPMQGGRVNNRVILSCKSAIIAANRYQALPLRFYFRRSEGRAWERG